MFIKYDYAAIFAGLSDINAKYGQLLVQADDVRSQQNALAVAWEDPESATAYQVAQGQWNSAFESVTAILNGVRNAAESATTSMQSTNRRAAAAWGG